MVSNTKTFHWGSRRQIFKLALTPSKPIPPLFAGTWACFWIQNYVSWQSHSVEHLDDCLDPALNLLNLVSMRLYQMWGTSHVKQHPALQRVCFPWRSQLSSAHSLKPGKQLLQDMIVLGLRRTDCCVTMALVWEDSSRQASYHAFHLLRLSLICIPEKHSDLPNN